MAVRTFLLPDLGEGLTEAELVAWMVEVGDTVAIDQPIAEVETAKSLVEVPSPFAGTVRELHGSPGDTIDVGKPLLSVAEGDDDGGAAPDAPEAGEATAGGPTGGAQPYREEERAGTRPEAAAEARPAEAADAGSGNVLIGYGTPGGAARGRTRRPKRAAAPARGPAAPRNGGPAGDDGSHTAAPLAAEAGDGARRAPLVVNPLVRKLAREHGVDVAALRGTGPDGLVLRADVLAAAQGAGPAAQETAVPAADGAQAPAGPGARAAAEPGGQDARTGLGVAAVVPVAGVRKAIAAAMTRSRTEIPEATVWVDVDATPLLELRAALKARGDAAVPGVLAFVSRFALAGLARHPELNARIEDDGAGGQRIVSFDGVNLGFAAQTDRGLVVPSIHRADTLSARGLDAELRRLTEIARAGKATPRELGSGTFTVNNYGVFGVDGSAAIINHPEAAILGLGRIADKPWVVDGRLEVRKVVQLTLAFDHRVCDGGTAGGFLRFVADCIENPGGVLADL